MEGPLLRERQTRSRAATLRVASRELQPNLTAEAQRRGAAANSENNREIKTNRKILPPKEGVRMTAWRRRSRVTVGVSQQCLIPENVIPEAGAFGIRQR